MKMEHALSRFAPLSQSREGWILVISYNTEGSLSVGAPVLGPFLLESALWPWKIT